SAPAGARFWSFVLESAAIDVENEYLQGHIQCTTTAMEKPSCHFCNNRKREHTPFDLSIDIWCRFRGCIPLVPGVIG
ncbi:MAG TPA: hypothetical protein VLT51_07175, partial [Anaerolineales bacterium]|nr:hypothetical protein [Anaerolineales bacterium]